MKKEKLKLNQLKVKSFTTSVENPKNIQGGERWSKRPGYCHHTGEPTIDVAGCNTADVFYCDNQTIGATKCIGPSNCCQIIIWV